MSPKRAALPGKDALFGSGVEGQGSRVAETATASEELPVAPPIPDSPAITAAPGHVQLCVWIAPEVADEVDRARARLLMDRGIKVTKSQIVEALLAPGLLDLEDLVRRLTG